MKSNVSQCQLKHLYEAEARRKIVLEVLKWASRKKTGAQNFWAQVTSVPIDKRFTRKIQTTHIFQEFLGFLKLFPFLYFDTGVDLLFKLLMSKATQILRGGGCAASKIQRVGDFFTLFIFHVEKIISKATVAANPQESQEIMISIQWFMFQEEYFYQLSKNTENFVKTYDLILGGIRGLLKSCLIYSEVISLYTTALLSKMIFSFHIMNEGRFCRLSLQQEFLDISDELEQQMEKMKQNDLIHQMKLYLFLTKTSFEIAPNNSKEKEDILKGFLDGIVCSIKMKPSQLLESLQYGTCKFNQMNSVQNNRKQYIVYYFFGMLQWETIRYFKNEKQKNLKEILLQIQDIHENLVKNSNNWENHFLWIQMIGKILVYNPLIKIQNLFRLVAQYHIEKNPRQIWKEYQKKGLLNQIIHNNDQAVIQINQFKNKSLNQFDRIMLEDCFKGWKHFILLKDFLQNEQNLNIHFTFRSYLTNNLIVNNIQSQKNKIILSINLIQKFFDLLISNKLLLLIKENYEKLGEVFETYRNCIENNTNADQRIQKNHVQFINKSNHSQLQNIYPKQSEYHQTNQNQIKEKKIYDRIIFIGNDQYIRKSIITKILDESLNEEQNDSTDEMTEIIRELQKLELKNNQALGDLRFLKLTLLLIRFNLKKLFIYNSYPQEQISNLYKSNNYNLNQLFEIQLNNLFIEYEELNQVLESDNNESMRFIMEIFQIKYDIDSFLKPKNSKEIERLKKYIQQFRRPQTHLFKQEIIWKKVIQKQQNFFLKRIIKDYPKRIFCSKSDIFQFTASQLNGIYFTEYDYQNKLSKQKGLIEYLQFCLLIEKQKISLEEIDLRLIEEELEQFIKKTPSQIVFVYEQIQYNIMDEILNFEESKLYKNKFENFLSELIKIQDQSKYQYFDQMEIDYYNRLANQTEIIIKTLKCVGKKEQKMFKMLMKEELKNFQRLVIQYDEFKTEKQNNQNKIQLQKEKEQVKQRGQEFNQSIKNYNGNLKCMIGIIQLQKYQIIEEEDLLNKLLEKITSFTDDLDLIQSYEVEDQIEYKNLFVNLFQELVRDFEQLALRHITIYQMEDENFMQYIERIKSFLSSTKKQIPNISASLNWFPTDLYEQLAEISYISNVFIDQELLILFFQKLFLFEKQEEEQQEKSNEVWKMKQGLVITLIQISTDCFTDTIISFCSKTLIQFWVSEKDERVRNLLKNENLIIIQTQILKKDWQTHQSAITEEMEQMLMRIDQLPTLTNVICSSQNWIKQFSNQINRQGLLMKWVNTQFEYLFYQLYHKKLIKNRGEIKKLNDQLESTKIERGNSIEQLLEIRKCKVLKESAYRNVKSIYVPLKTFQKGKKEQINLIKLNQSDDIQAEVMEFLLKGQTGEKTVMLIHGITRSGKSTTAKKIEEFIWKIYERNQKISNQVLIPIYISLPSLKDPLFQAVEETLCQEDYGFDDIQLKE
ncbi:unnamed protein product [Paramecium sonneborni]|uniref:Uncharacterized protein n=1 Tax=Paramecium sonneborni TaxID=65129 RepID=A0A8S1RQ74_9CILI|nr:unnamed protein product [Paramecium sonneborni]